MLHTFDLRYEIDAPLAITVATYLDCEHYVYLHKNSKEVKVYGHTGNSYDSHIMAMFFGVKVGQRYTSTYVPPATFVQDNIKPFPKWIPSLHHVMSSKTQLRYFESMDRGSTLSELTVELDLPWWLYPYRKLIEAAIVKVKILKDLEDVAMIERRARLFGRRCNDEYLNANQFILHKNEYLRYFGKNSVYLGPRMLAYKDQCYTNIKDLDYGYVRNFLKTQYHKYC